MPELIKTEEKFVSIAYSTWQNKYLPMEKELESAKQQLDTEIRRKSGTLFMNIDRHYNEQLSHVLGYDKWNAIGTIDYSIENAPMISLDNRVNLAYRIQEYQFKNRGVSFITAEQLRNGIKEIEKKNDERMLAYQAVKQRTDKIPKFVKWLFKIKL